MSAIYTEIRDWYGYDIMYVFYNEKWYAVLDDICRALGIKNVHDTSMRIPLEYQEKIRVKRTNTTQNIGAGVDSTYISQARNVLCVDSRGITFALMGSRKLEARKFQMWALDILDELYYDMGIDGRNVMSLADERIQETYNIKRHTDIEYNTWHPGSIIDSFIDDNSGELIYVCYNNGPDNYIEVPADLYDTWLTRDPTDEELDWLENQEFIPYDPD